MQSTGNAISQSHSTRDNFYAGRQPGLGAATSDPSSGDARKTAYSVRASRIDHSVYASKLLDSGYASRIEESVYASRLLDSGYASGLLGSVYGSGVVDSQSSGSGEALDPPRQLPELPNKNTSAFTPAPQLDEADSKQMNATSGLLESCHICGVRSKSPLDFKEARSCS